MVRLSHRFSAGPIMVLLSWAAFPSMARAQFVGHYTGEVSIKNQGVPKHIVDATVEIISRQAGGVLVTLRDGTYNPSMVAFFDGIFLNGQELLPSGTWRTLNAGWSLNGNDLSLQICLGPSPGFGRCDFREFIFEGPLSPYGACVLPPNGSCQSMQEFFCLRNEGTYLGDDAGACAQVGACTAGGVCNQKTQVGCSMIGGIFDGVGSVCPLGGATIRWDNPDGGDYAISTNWDPAQVPIHNGLRSDAAVFDLATGATIAITGSSATAGRWEILNSFISFSGNATLSSTASLPPSLALGFGGELTYASGFLTTQHAIVGSGDPRARVVIGANASWFNLGSLNVGGTLGPGLVELAENSHLSVGGGAAFGNGGEGELRVRAGALAQFQSSLLIGSVSGGEARVSVSGSSATRQSRLQATGFTIIGTLTSSPIPAMVIAENGGELSFGGGLNINDSTAEDGTAVVTIDGLDSQAFITGSLTIGDLSPGNLLIKNGGTVTCDQLFLGTQVAGSQGQLRLEGLGSGIIVNQNVGIGGSGGHGAIVLTEGTYLDVMDSLRVGDMAGGSLSTATGVHVTVGNGLFVGGASGGPGSFIVAGHNAELTVTGITEVGSESPGTQAHFTVRDQAVATMHDDLFIDHEDTAVNAAAVFVFSGGVLNVDGDIAIGVSKPADMIVSGAAVECDRLTVGSDTAGSSGFVILGPNGLMYVADAQIGGSGGYGIMLVDAGSTLSVFGNVFVGGAQGGLVTVNGVISGEGMVAAIAGGIINGTGRITAAKIESGGTIAPGLSPGTLTIDGEFEQMQGGRLELEYGGLTEGEFDRLVVTGEATLGGRLEIQFVNGFSPPDPRSFIQSRDFVEADQGIVGDYDERTFVFPDLFADFDEDGDKDLSDVAVFQNCFGLSGKASPPQCDRADWEHDGNLTEREVSELSRRISGPKE